MLIFISYRSADRPLIETMANDLHGLGYTVWFDQELTGGHAWWNSILKNVQECDLFIFALSPQSLDSYPCQLEYSYADALEKRILPVLLRDINAELLPPALSKIQFVDYRMQDKKASISLARALASLPPTQPLPDPLPVPPEAPISGFGRMKERIESNAGLSLDEQASLVLELKGFYQKADTRTTAQELFQRLRSRSDLFASIDHEIENILAVDQPVANPQPLVTKTISAPRTPPKVDKPTISVDSLEARLQTMLGPYIWAVLGAFVFMTPLATLDDGYHALSNQILFALITGVGLLLTKTITSWLPTHLPERLFRFRVPLTLLIPTAFAGVIGHYGNEYPNDWVPIVISLLQPLVLIAGFLIGTIRLEDRLRARILIGAVGAFCAYFLPFLMPRYSVWSFPLVGRYVESQVSNSTLYLYVNYPFSTWVWYIAAALACSLLVYWPELAQMKVTQTSE